MHGVQYSFVIMATNSRIKTFQFLRNIYQTSGFYKPEAKHYWSLNTKVLFILIYYNMFFVASSAYLLFKTKSIGDLIYSYCTTVTIIFGIVNFLVYPSKIPNTLLLIEKFDEIIHKSKLKIGEIIFISVCIYIKNYILLHICKS